MCDYDVCDDVICVYDGVMCVMMYEPVVWWWHMCDDVICLWWCGVWWLLHSFSFSHLKQSSAHTAFVFRLILICLGDPSSDFSFLLSWRIIRPLRPSSDLSGVAWSLVSLHFFGWLHRCCKCWRDSPWRVKSSIAEVIRTVSRSAQHPFKSVTWGTPQLEGLWHHFWVISSKFEVHVTFI